MPTVLEPILRHFVSGELNSVETHREILNLVASRQITVDEAVAAYIDAGGNDTYTFRKQAMECYEAF